MSPKADSFGWLLHPTNRWQCWARRMSSNQLKNHNPDIKLSPPTFRQNAIIFSGSHSQRCRRSGMFLPGCRFEEATCLISDFFPLSKLLLSVPHLDHAWLDCATLTGETGLTGKYEGLWLHTDSTETTLRHWRAISLWGRPELLVWYREHVQWVKPILSNRELLMIEY